MARTKPIAAGKAQQHPGKDIQLLKRLKDPETEPPAIKKKQVATKSTGGGQRHTKSPNSADKTGRAPTTPDEKKKPVAKMRAENVSAGLVKPHRFRAGTMALREIRKFQKSTDFLIRKVKPRLVKISADF